MKKENLTEADQEFDNLGYIKKNLTDKWDRIWGIEYINTKKWISIEIDHVDKEICIGSLGDDEYKANNEPVYINLDEIKAINNKIKELKWYEQ